MTSSGISVQCNCMVSASSMCLLLAGMMTCPLLQQGMLPMLGTIRCIATNISKKCLLKFLVSFGGWNEHALLQVTYSC